MANDAAPRCVWPPEAQVQLRSRWAGAMGATGTPRGAGSCDDSLGCLEQRWPQHRHRGDHHAERRERSVQLAELPKEENSPQAHEGTVGLPPAPSRSDIHDTEVDERTSRHRLLESPIVQEVHDLE